MKFIFCKQLIYYTKETLKKLNLIVIALLLVITMIFIKYKPVYSVKIDGTQVGYIENKEQLKNIVQNANNQMDTENVAYVDIKTSPECQLTFVNKKQEMNEEQILNKIKEKTEITYEYYAVTVDEEQKSIVDSLNEAEKLVADLKKEYKTSMKNVNVEINKIYTTEQNQYEIVTTQEVKKTIEKKLQQVENSSVNGVYLAQKPISGVITSRFGSRESIRSHAHTGLDIAAPYGTPIKAAASGTVVWSGERGSYGNLVIVDCGNNVKIYYGHCSKLNVSEGKKVTAGDVIAEVGSTGNSTGNHLHFEIRVNDVQVNPQNYIYN